MSVCWCSCGTTTVILSLLQMLQSQSIKYYQTQIPMSIFILKNSFLQLPHFYREISPKNTTKKLASLMQGENSKNLCIPFNGFELQFRNNKMMNKSEARKKRQNLKMGSIANQVQLKLVQSSHNGTNMFKFDEHSLKAGSIINTPSTISDLKKFRSCQLNKRSKVSATPPLQSIHFEGRDRGCVSATKILTLHEIKQVEEKTRVKEEQPAAICRSSSRKLFVSISKRNGHLQEYKKQPDPQIKVIQCGNIGEQRQTRQKIKLNIYKDIARKNNHK